MRNFCYLLIIVGLVVSLAGCGDSGGGYWPVAPDNSLTGKQVESLGGGGVVAVANNLFAVSTSGTCPAVQNMNIALNAGAPMLNLAGTPAAKLFASLKSIQPGLRAAGVSKKRSEATNFSGIETPTTDSSTGYTLFKYSYSLTDYMYASVRAQCGEAYNSSSCTSSTQVTKTYTYETYVKLVDASGNTIPITSDSTYWFSYATAPEKMYYYGKWTLTIKGSGYDWTETTTIGSRDNPWTFENLTTYSSTNPVKIKGSSSTTAAGTYNGETVPALVYTYSIYGLSGTGSSFEYYSSGYPKGCIVVGDSNLTVTVKFDGSKTATLSYSPAAPAGAATTISLDQFVIRQSSNHRNSFPSFGGFLWVDK